MDMDVAMVLDSIDGGSYKPYYWGPLSNTGNTYAELASMWPASNPALPTEQEMLDHWDTINV